VIARDTWHKGIGGLSVPVSNGTDFGAITIPVATASISERDMRGALTAKVLELAGRHLLLTPRGGNS
jgi:hypothetical protein